MKTTHRRSTPAYGRGSLRTARRPRLGGGGKGKVQVENPADPPSYHLQPDALMTNGLLPTVGKAKE
jgi:hypothetical protein